MRYKTYGGQSLRKQGKSLRDIVEVGTAEFYHLPIF